MASTTIHRVLTSMIDDGIRLVLVSAYRISLSTRIEVLPEVPIGLIVKPKSFTLYRIYLQHFCRTFERWLGINFPRVRSDGVIGTWLVIGLLTVY